MLLDFDRILLYIAFDTERALNEGALAIGEHASGAVLYTDNSMGGQPVQAGMLVGGEIIFDEFGLGSDDVVSGTINTKIFAFAD